LTSYAVRLLQDVYFLDWLVEPPVGIVSRQHMGSIESKKAESDLFSPAAGQLVELNESVLDDPSLINAEPYEGGWLFAMRLADESGLMNPQGYSEHLVKAWEVAQRTIKGQANL
jgi:glycine cleavage system H protein